MTPLGSHVVVGRVAAELFAEVALDAAEVGGRGGFGDAAALGLLEGGAGLLEFLVAATAKTHGLTVATLNVRHFEGLHGLAVEDWS